MKFIPKIDCSCISEMLDTVYDPFEQVLFYFGSLAVGCFTDYYSIIDEYYTIHVTIRILQRFPGQWLNTKVLPLCIMDAQAILCTASSPLP